jgi:hypothetical protein
MSIEDELLRLAQLCRSQARLTEDRGVKQALRKLGDHYESEAKKLQGHLSANLPQSRNRNATRSLGTRFGSQAEH